jgi:DNA-binding HxlR family transcriptional regulator
MPRRSYDQYCPLSRALDMIGERWALLIIRELLAGPRRYTDLHADLPGVSTDVLATRLREMEQDGLVSRRRLPPPAAATVYELTPHAQDLLPALTALADWGAAAMTAPRPTDALRAHWTALPLMRQLADLAVACEGVVNVALSEGSYHIAVDHARTSYGHAPVEHADAQLTVDTYARQAVIHDQATLLELIKDGHIDVAGDSPLADALRG